MQTTPNYAFKKPELNDSPPDITVTNPNWDIIDQLIKARIENALIANNLITTTPGMVLDARQGKVLKDEVNAINNNFVYGVATFGAKVIASAVPFAITKCGNSILISGRIKSSAQINVNDELLTLPFVSASALDIIVYDVITLKVYSAFISSNKLIASNDIPVDLELTINANYRAL